MLLICRVGKWVDYIRYICRLKWFLPALLMVMLVVAGVKCRLSMFGVDYCNTRVNKGSTSKNDRDMHEYREGHHVSKLSLELSE